MANETRGWSSLVTTGDRLTVGTGLLIIIVTLAGAWP